MNLTELITSANARGHIGVRGEVRQSAHGGLKLDITNNLLQKAISLDLIKLVSAWRSTEDDLPEYRGGPVDRRVYGLTHKGWDLKINARDLLSYYQSKVLAEAKAAHWGKLDGFTPDLRYPEKAFDNWEIATGRWGPYPDHENAPTPKHQHPRGPMPNTAIDPPLIESKTQGQPLKRYTYDEVTQGLPEVPDDYWLDPPHVPLVEKVLWSFSACALLAILAGAGWWLS